MRNFAGSPITAWCKPAIMGCTLALSWILIVLSGCESANDTEHFAISFIPNPTNAADVTVMVARDGKSKRSPFKKEMPLDSMLQVMVAGSIEPLLGRHELLGHGLAFTPRFPLVPGQSYEARFDPGGASRHHSKDELRTVIALYSVPPEPRAKQPQLKAIYPTADVLPANHLKFYLVFSEPMWRGEFLQHIRLLDDRGAEVPEPFRETELWSADGKRLTLWFHPGRQKTGVNLNVEIGPVLEAGRRYRLVVSRKWTSQGGLLLTADSEKIFAVSAPEHARLDIQVWKIFPPHAGTRDTMKLEFPKALDWALLQNQIVVRAKGAGTIGGNISIGASEKSWQFTPHLPWPAAELELVAAGVLEDLAGNSLARPFEVDAQKPEQMPAPVEFSRTFTVKP